MERIHSTVASYRQFTLTIVVLVHVAHARSYVITVGAWCRLSLLHTFQFWYSAARLEARVCH